VNTIRMTSITVATAAAAPKSNPVYASLKGQQRQDGGRQAGPPWVRMIIKSGAFHQADHPQDHRGDDDRGKQRQGDAPEAVPRVGAVNFGGLVQLLRHALQAGQQEQREKREVLPQIDDQDCA